MTERLIAQVLLDRAWGGVAVNCNCRMVIPTHFNTELGTVVSELSFPSLSAIDRLKVQDWVRKNMATVKPDGYFLTEKGKFYAIKHR